MDVVILPREEEVYDREAICGRDTHTVFPSIEKNDPGKYAVKDAMNKKFVTESQLEELKSKHGLRPDDGTMTIDKPLAQLLSERKAAKHEEFQEQWRQMKIGKNRPLEDDELEFINSISEAERAKEKVIQDREKEEMNDFKELLKKHSTTSMQTKDPEESVSITAKSSIGSFKANTSSKSTPCATLLSSATPSITAAANLGFPAFLKVAKKKGDARVSDSSLVSMPLTDGGSPKLGIEVMASSKRLANEEALKKRKRSMVEEEEEDGGENSPKCLCRNTTRKSDNEDEGGSGLLGGLLGDYGSDDSDNNQE